MTDGSRSGMVLLPQRAKNKPTQMSSNKHRRAHTAPQCRGGSLHSGSSSSSLNDDGQDSSRSPSSPRHGQISSSSRPYSCYISCRVSVNKPAYFEYQRPYSVYRAPLKRARSVPASFRDSYHMNHPGLDSGQKTYLWNTAAVYSVTNMKALQTRRYKQLLQHQVDIGSHTQAECDRYLRYILGTRKRQYSADPSVWRDPPKIPVRPKSFHLPSPSPKQLPPRDFRYYPRGYDEDKSKGDDNCKSARGQQQRKGRTEDKGRAEDGVLVDGADDGSSKKMESLSSSDDKSLSESMQGMSLYYDSRRKTTVSRGRPEKGEESEDGEEEGPSSSAPKTSHQNCFWGSH